MHPAVLILAYEFPPLATIAAQRPWSWYRYFPDFGLRPVVVTRHWDETVSSPVDHARASSPRHVTVEADDARALIRVPHVPNLRDRMLLKHGVEGRRLPRRALTAFHTVSDFFSTRADNMAGLYHQARRRVGKGDVRAVLATGGPFQLFGYADRLGRESGIPWIADYRDGWTTNESKTGLTWVDRWFHRPLEKRLVQRSAGITAAAPSYGERLERLHGRQVTTVMNGFDPEVHDSAKTAGEQGSDRFEIAYAGTMYPHQRIGMFLEGYRAWRRRHPDIPSRLVFYGTAFPGPLKSVLEEARRDLGEDLVVAARMPHVDVLRALKKASVLLLLANRGKDWLYAKVFDYLALERPILLVENDRGPMERLLKEAGGGCPCESPDDVATALDRIHRSYASGEPAPCVAPRYVQHSRKHRAGEMADLLKELVARS